MLIPGNQYKLFLAQVKKLYETELQRLKISPKNSKVAYWKELAPDGNTVIWNLNIGTTEILHFYLRENSLKNHPDGFIEESDKVIVEELNTIGLEVSKSSKQKFAHLPIKERLREEANEVFQLFLDISTDRKQLDKNSLTKNFEQTIVNYNSATSKVAPVVNTKVVDVDNDQSLLERKLETLLYSYYYFISNDNYTEAHKLTFPLYNYEDTENTISFTEKIFFLASVKIWDFCPHPNSYFKYYCKVAFIEYDISISRSDLFFLQPDSDLFNSKEITEYFVKFFGEYKSQEKCDNIYRKIINEARRTVDKDVFLKNPDKDLLISKIITLLNALRNNEFYEYLTLLFTGDSDRSTIIKGSNRFYNVLFTCEAHRWYIERITIF